MMTKSKPALTVISDDSNIDHKSISKELIDFFSLKEQKFRCVVSPELLDVYLKTQGFEYKNDHYYLDNGNGSARILITGSPSRYIVTALTSCNYDISLNEYRGTVYTEEDGHFDVTSLPGYEEKIEVKSFSDLANIGMILSKCPMDEEFGWSREVICQMSTMSLIDVYNLTAWEPVEHKHLNTPHRYTQPLGNEIYMTGSVMDGCVLLLEINRNQYRLISTDIRVSLMVKRDHDNLSGEDQFPGHHLKVYIERLFMDLFGTIPVDCDMEQGYTTKLDISYKLNYLLDTEEDWLKPMILNWEFSEIAKRDTLREEFSGSFTEGKGFRSWWRKTLSEIKSWFS